MNKPIKKTWVKIPFWLKGGIIGGIVGFILSIYNKEFLKNYSLYGGYPIWITLTYFFPLYIFYILIWIPLSFFRINLGSMENPNQFILFIKYFYFILFYFRIINLHYN